MIEAVDRRASLSCDVCVAAFVAAFDAKTGDSRRRVADREYR
jgi:hypothetical protein